jgi:hypothetical protein
MLLQTRKLILGAYFQVEIAGRISHAVQLIADGSFDLIVLCSSLADHECERVARLARTQNPRPKVLTLSETGRQSSGHEAGDELMVEIGPLALIRKSTAMLGLEMKGNGRRASRSLADNEKLLPH